jgi:hypothetical protein
MDNLKEISRVMLNEPVLIFLVIVWLAIVNMAIRSGRYENK